MILVTKLDRSSVLLNLESVKFFEKSPDTIVFFLNGDTMIIRESLEEVQRLVTEQRVRIVRSAQQVQAAGAY